MPPAKAKDYQKLLDKRDNAISALKFHEEKVKALTENQPIEALARLNSVETLYEKFRLLCDQLEDHDDFVYSDFAISNEDVLEMFIVASAKLRTITKVGETSIFNSTQNRANNAIVDVELPRIEIPTFSGNYQEWTAFIDAFTSLVDSNTNVQDVNKLHYLRGSLRDGAFRLKG